MRPHGRKRRKAKLLKGFTIEDLKQEHRDAIWRISHCRRKKSNGATVATGKIHTVIGAIHLAWYHSVIPKTFRDMRFLFSERADVDLLIGTESIVNHNLISPPNLNFVDTVGSSGTLANQTLSAQTLAEKKLLVPGRGLSKPRGMLSKI
ncbi:hypothetical protein P154DRAFT_539634 [Amniculicola lignicola CBS 123094]|uniref:Uncharacterized protein n=1 Tax=Amniculicola lignicola CBS 123094 TaxID=1392246 RepID=A0A6A5W0G3_9PLEO|nr:hypothetical protein P154DRAFT_539634 [Amniculicola lignicola CBS 123094]